MVKALLISRMKTINWLDFNLETILWMRDMINRRPVDENGKYRFLSGLLPGAVIVVDLRGRIRPPAPNSAS
jgi:hypothetical protein